MINLLFGLVGSDLRSKIELNDRLNLTVALNLNLIVLYSD